MTSNDPTAGRAATAAPAPTTATAGTTVVGGTSVSDHAGTWTLDAEHTSVEFHTKAMWVLGVKGTASALRGGGTVGEDGAVSGKLVIDATSIDTRNKRRDAHLQTADFFDTMRHPTIELEATGVRFVSPGRAEVTGTLIVHGQGRPITVPADVEVDDGSVTLSAEVAIDRSEWGMTWAKMGAGLRNRVVVHARFTKD